ncbi:MAG: chemotaxis protein [Deltaproteobacteria bacterium]|nr:chemotaxis protein [Deltaproteobacteria bacterium]
MIGRHARFVAAEFILRKMRCAMVNARLRVSFDGRAMRTRNPALMAAEIKRQAWGCDWERDVQRKVFRIEQMFTGDRAPASARAEQHHATDNLKALRSLAEHRDNNAAGAIEILQHELAQIHETIARNKRELGLLIGDGKERRMARAAGELGAAVDGMEKATERILKSVEVVDDSAKALTATLKDDYARGLAQDIQDHVVKIYEDCNFQDLAGQRIGNVVHTLNSIELQVAAMLERCDAVSGKAPAKPAPGRGLLNGPRLDGDSGHASQRDIDKMFS